MRLPVAVAKATPGRTRNDPSSERGAVATSPPNPVAAPLSRQSAAAEKLRQPRTKRKDQNMRIIVEKLFSLIAAVTLSGLIFNATVV